MSAVAFAEDARRAGRSALVEELRRSDEVRWGKMLCDLVAAGVPLGTRVAVGRDIESASLLNFASGTTGGGGYSGTSSTAVTGTTFTTDGVNFAVNSLAGQYIIATTTNIRFGIIQSNTSAANSVLTIDRWYDATAVPANVNTAAASAPAAGAWMIPPGNVPAAYMGLTASAVAAVDGDTTLASEINTAGASGLDRQLATYAHTGSGTTTTLTKTFTVAAADTIPVTVAQIGIFQGVVLAASRLVFRTLLNATATVSAISDQIAITETVTL